MLLIGDIHISSRLGDQMIKSLENFVAGHTDEQNIIFLWDYVYHFSYDRNALLALYNFFVKLFEEGKNVYVLAWNHDRLWQHFVYVEAKKAFDLLAKLDAQTPWKLKFITEPFIETVDGEKILFFPYMLDPWTEPEKFSETKEGRENGVKMQIQELKNDENKHKVLAGKINAKLLDLCQKEEKLTVLHHYYFNKIKFPGQKARFYFKDIALSEFFLEASNLKFIPGHLHHAFSHKNYFRLGSVRSTSSLENSQLRCLAKYSPSSWIDLYQNNINPYFFLEATTQSTSSLFEQEAAQDESLTHSTLQKSITQILEDSTKNFSDQSGRKINFHPADITDFNTVTINLKVSDLDYEKIDNYIEPSLRKELKEVKLKKQQQSMAELLDDFDTASQNLSTSFSDRKNILKSYLKQKFGDDAEKYESILREEKLL